MCACVKLEETREQPTHSYIELIKNGSTSYAVVNK